ncbi:MAG: hypothetical protein ACO29Q_03875 [Crocinitomicaceae bacterium]|jgi:hypothetical protein
MTKFRILFIFLIFASISEAQILQLTCIDKRTGDFVSNVGITMSPFLGGDSIVYQVTVNGKSNYSLEKVNVGSTLNFEFRHAIYQTSNLSFYYKERKDTIRLEVLLVPMRIQLSKEVIVKSVGVPDTVFGSKRLSVADFELQANGDVIILAYPKQLQKGSELLLYNGSETKSSVVLNDAAIELKRDFRGNAHVICKEHVYGVYSDGDQIELGLIPKDYYFKYIEPIVDTNTSKIFFSDFSKIYPAFDYYVFDKLDSSYKSIVNIKDDLMMELYRSEYKWMDVRTKLWAKNKEMETGIDAEIYIGANYFTQSIYYKEVYAPMFHRNDSIFVFNYPKDLLLIYSIHGVCMDTIPLYHHYQAKETGWRRNVIQDRVTGSIYTTYEKDGHCYLGLINIGTGEVVEKVKLSFRYVDKIRVHNNYVYYIYRPFESTQKKFLYKEKLPYQFKGMDQNYGTNISIDGHH